MPENRDKFFKGQQENEEFICFFRRHWITIFKELIYFSIFLALVVLTLINMGIIKDVLMGNRELKMLFIIAFVGMTFVNNDFIISCISYLQSVPPT